MPSFAAQTPRNDEAASAAKQKTSRGLWSLGVCLALSPVICSSDALSEWVGAVFVEGVLMVIIALLLQQLQEIRAILQVSPR